jgi:Bacterial membrane protein YfhO
MTSHSNRSFPLGTLVTALALSFLGALIFREFLFGGATLLYKDSGSDSVNDYYPWFVHLSQYIRSEGIPSWSFSVGMGQDILFFVGYLILEPVSWLPKELIAPGLVYQHLAKVVVTGLLFCRFLRLRDLNPTAAFLGSLLVSFSAYMCLGACWYPLADDVVCFAALLVAVEETLVHGRWFLLPLAVGLVGFIDSFHLYLCALFLSLYVPGKLFGRHGWRPRPILRGCLILGGAAVLGVGLGAVVTLPNFHTILNSPRGSGSTSFVSILSSFPIFGLEARAHYVTAALRPFSNDILGTAEGFRGWGNYLEAPITYCGLVCLVISPQAFFGAARRFKIIYGLLLGGIVLTTVFPWFRYLFWLFQGDYYRALSLFSILGLVTLGMIGFSRFINGRLNLWVLAATTIVLLGTLYLPLGELHTGMDSSLKRYATIFLGLYTLLLAIGHITRWPQVLALVIVALASAELIVFDHITVSKRNTVSKDELGTRVGYNDDTVEALKDIKAADNSSFYRVTKIRPSGPGVYPSLNDAMVFGYYGTSSYSSFNNINYINFLTAVDAIRPNSESDTRWSIGLLDNSILSLFAGEKYALVENPRPWQRALQYEFVKRYEEDFLFRNARFLPLGLSFDRYILQDTFRKLDSLEKPEVLLRAVVLSNEADAEKLGLTPVAVPDLEQEIRRSSLEEVVATRRKSALDLTSFRQTQIKGNVTLEQKAVLVLQTPFDRGWEAWQDGKSAPVVKVDVGLLGVGLDRGQHKVELRYETPFLGLGLGIALGSLLFLTFAAWRWPRLKLID